MSAYGNAAVAQSVERRIGSAEVTGPIPVSSFVTKEEEALAFARAFNFLFHRKFLPVK